MPELPSIHANNFDRVADIYDATRGFSPAVEAGIGEGLAGILRANAPAPCVLEVGVGSGRIAVPWPSKASGSPASTSPPGCCNACARNVATSM
jgi:ubiquinone/menaquinone biosynthesis C-methylase UbiE